MDATYLCMLRGATHDQTQLMPTTGPNDAGRMVDVVVQQTYSSVTTTVRSMNFIPTEHGMPLDNPVVGQLLCCIAYICTKSNKTPCSKHSQCHTLNHFIPNELRMLRDCVIVSEQVTLLHRLCMKTVALPMHEKENTTWLAQFMPHTELSAPPSSSQLQAKKTLRQITVSTRGQGNPTAAAS